MTEKAPKSSKNDCSMTSKASDELASPASMQESSPASPSSSARRRVTGNPDKPFIVRSMLENALRVHCRSKLASFFGEAGEARLSELFGVIEQSFPQRFGAQVGPRFSRAHASCSDCDRSFRTSKRGAVQEGCATLRNFCVRNFLPYSIIWSPIFLKLGQEVPHTIEN